VKASLQRAARQPALKPKDKPASEGPAFAPGCSGTLLKLGACPSEAHLAGSMPAEVKQAFLGAVQLLLLGIPGPDAVEPCLSDSDET
jgi:hypothetical protein